jgi:hypothetical protein
MLVVNYFMKHVNWSAVPLERSLHSLDRHFYAGTVSARLSYDDLKYCHMYASSLED